LVKEYYENSGYKVQEEFAIGQGKTIDLVAMKGIERIAIEIETGKSDAVGNINKCLEVGFEKIVVVALTFALKQKIQRQVISINISVDRLIIVSAGELVNKIF